MSYGSWRCPECGSEFFGGGRALHEPRCALGAGYDGCVYRYSVGEKAELEAGRLPALAPRNLLDLYQAQLVNKKDGD